MGAGNEYSLDHHYWVCGRSDREAPSSRKQVRAFWIYRDYPARDCRSFCRDIPRPGSGVVSSWRERGFHWSNRWRNHSTGSVGDNRSSPSADVGLIASHVASPVLPPASSLEKRRAVTNEGQSKAATARQFVRSGVNLQVLVGWQCSQPGWRRPIASQNVQLASHSAGAPAGGTAGVSSHAGAIYHVHTRSTCFADSNDCLVQLLEGCERHSLCG
jgi:hypothetical protein